MCESHSEQNRVSHKNPRSRIRPLALPFLVVLLVILPACFTNNPYRSSEAGRNIFYDTFGEEPKHFDPAVAYGTDCAVFICQVYEPVVQYHYLKRPYTLVGRAAQEVASPRYMDHAGRQLPDNAPGEQIAETIFDIRIKPGIRFAPHPAFAKNPQGAYVYHDMKREELADKHQVTAQTQAPLLCRGSPPYTEHIEKAESGLIKTEVDAIPYPFLAGIFTHSPTPINTASHSAQFKY